MDVFSNLSLKGKFWLFASLFIGVLVFATALAYRSTSQLGDQTTELASVQLPAVRAMTLVDMQHDGLRAVALEAYRGVVEKDDAALGAAVDEAREKGNLIRSYLGELKKMPLQAEVTEAINAAVPDVNGYVEATESIVALASKKDLAGVRSALPAFEENFRKLEKSLEVLVT